MTPPEASRHAVEARNLELVFDAGGQAVHALSDVDLTVERGEFVSLIGPSGCGKTSLLRIVADLAQPTGGTMLVNGIPPSQARQRRDYGYVFQAPALLGWRTVLRNVTLPLEILGLAKAQRRQRAQAQLQRVGLAQFGGKFPWQLSGGMQQRVSIARALALEPKLLLMDEPFGALDEITRDQLNLQLRQLWAEQQSTVLFVTHSIAEAVFLSTRILVMSARPGRIIDDIRSDLPAVRDAALRDTPEFLAIAHRVRTALLAGHG